MVAKLIASDSTFILLRECADSKDETSMPVSTTTTSKTQSEHHRRKTL